MEQVHVMVGGCTVMVGGILWVRVMVGGGGKILWTHKAHCIECCELLTWEHVC